MSLCITTTIYLPQPKKIAFFVTVYQPCHWTMVEYSLVFFLIDHHRYGDVKLYAKTLAIIIDWSPITNEIFFPNISLLVKTLMGKTLTVTIWSFTFSRSPTIDRGKRQVWSAYYLNSAHSLFLIFLYFFVCKHHSYCNLLCFWFSIKQKSQNILLSTSLILFQNECLSKLSQRMTEKWQNKPNYFSRLQCFPEMRIVIIIMFVFVGRAWDGCYIVCSKWKRYLCLLFHKIDLLGNNAHHPSPVTVSGNHFNISRAA